MTELLNRDDETTTVCGEYRWRPAVDAFADATPVTRPAIHAGSYDLLSSFYRRQMFDPSSRLSHSEPVRMAIPTYLITVSAGAAFVVDDEPVALALFGDLRDDLHGVSEYGLRVVTVAGETSHEPDEHPGTSALRELQEWTGLGLDALVALVGLAPSTRAYWRSNPTAPVRPSKAGRLLRLRLAVGLLVGEIGLPAARLTLNGEGWLNGTLDEDRLSDLERRVQQILLPQGLTPPAHLSTGLSRKELLARAIGDRADAEAEAAQRDSESSDTSYLGRSDAPEET